MLDQRPTPLITHVPLVLAVGCPPSMVQRCMEVATPWGVVIAESDLMNMRTEAARARPIALLMTRDVYAFDPEEFQALAQDVGAVLVVARSEAFAATQIERLLGLPALRGEDGES
jgi:hypothetical protein